jgi:signal transduction histidine kinase
MPHRADPAPSRRRLGATSAPSVHRHLRAAGAPPVLTDGASPKPSPLREIEGIVSDFAEATTVRAASEPAYRRALALTASSRPRILAERIARISFAADLIAALMPELAYQKERLRVMVDRLDASAKLPRLILGREVLGSPQLFQLRPAEAVQAALSVVLAFAPARAAAIWQRTANGTVTLLASAGEAGALPAESETLAAAAVGGRPVTARIDGDLAVAEIRRPGTAPAALVVFGEDVLAPGRRLLLEAAQPCLALALGNQRVDAVPVTGAGASAPHPPRHGQLEPQEVAEAVKRRLTRLRFDLHDGPQQDVFMLAEDLRQFRVRLEDVLDGREGREQLLGGVDDLEARLVALDGDLRRLSASAESPFLQPAALPDALTGVAEAFATRTGIAPTLEMSGDLTHLTDSQHITLLALIREALSNVREHAEARHVSVVVSAQADGLTASVVDDGRGFEPETTLIDAARGGHLGLVSMHERVRMLGGRTEINSRPGGPTVISVTLPVIGAAAIG